MPQKPSLDADRPHRHLLESVDLQPVFIVGDSRSGTTVLYHLLARTGCFNPVTVYHILCGHELLSNRDYFFDWKD